MERALVGFSFAEDVIPISRDDRYLQTSSAPAYRAQLPFHVAQRDDQSCALASLAQVASALRASRALPPLSQDAMANVLGKHDWQGGVVLAELDELSRRATARADLEADVAMHYAAPRDAGAIARFRHALAAVEAGHAYVVVNFQLETLLAVDEGHYSPLGAFDADTDRVLVLDTYRQGWEPYWVPVARLWAAMTEIDEEAGASRGFVVFRRSRTP